MDGSSFFLGGRGVLYLFFFNKRKRVCISYQTLDPNLKKERKYLEILQPQIRRAFTVDLAFYDNQSKLLLKKMLPLQKGTDAHQYQMFPCLQMVQQATINYQFSKDSTTKGISGFNDHVQVIYALSDDGVIIGQLYLAR